MKSVIGIVLVLSFTLQAAANLLLWIHYEWNKAYISKVLCEKKNLLNSCCKGKCFLKKQVDKQEEISSGTGDTKEQKVLKIPSVKDTFIDQLTYFFDYKQKASSLTRLDLKKDYCTIYLSTLERPPKILF